MKNKNVAAILAIIFGGFGVHKFYLREPGSGIFYMLLTFITAGLRFPVGYILGWIDAFVLFTMDEEKFDQKYNAHENYRNSRRQDPRVTRRRNSRTRQRSNDFERPSSAPQRRTAREMPKENPFKKTGLKSLEDYEIDRAEEELRRAIEISPNDVEIHFGLAKAYSNLEQVDKAYYHISKAKQLGFSEDSKILSDEKLAFVRTDKNFKEFQRNGYMYPPRKAETEPKEIVEEVKNNEIPKEDLLEDDMLLSQLNKLSELRKKGLLSEKEFQEEKVKLLNR